MHAVHGSFVYWDGLASQTIYVGQYSEFDVLQLVIKSTSPRQAHVYTKNNDHEQHTQTNGQEIEVK